MKLVKITFFLINDFKAIYAKINHCLWIDLVQTTKDCAKLCTVPSHCVKFTIFTILLM
jgi:hypothetical protein